MEQSTPELVEAVDADPGAVFDAHGADSVDELVAPEPDASGSGDDAAVEGLLEGSLSAPERTRHQERPAEQAADRTVDDAASPEPIAVDLERAIEETPSRREAEHAREEPAADVADDVAAALADAEDVREGELPETISFE